MARSTQVLKTGIQILAGSNVPIYSLEYLDASSLHKSGDYEKIVVPYIEMGRDRSCVIKFDDDVLLVSRKHAAISREGTKFILKHLSATNSTYLNDQAVTSEAVLANGDVIKLSAQGPRLRFNTTTSGTAHLGFTNRMNLVINQAVKPYRKVLAVFFLVFMAVVSTLTWTLRNTQERLDEQILLSQAQASSIAEANLKNEEFSRLMGENEAKFKAQIADMGMRMKAISKANEEKEPDLSKVEKEEIAAQKAELSTSDINSEQFSDYVEVIQPYVMAIFLNEWKLEFKGEVIESQRFDDPICMCTGFLIESGDFITARHCIDLLFEEAGDYINFYINSGGNLYLSFTAKSSDSSLNFDFTNKQMVYDSSKDLNYSVDDPISGLKGVLRKTDFFNGSDWAILKRNGKVGIPFDKSSSSNLQAATDLYIMGFPDGMTFRLNNDLRPDVNKGVVRRQGLINGVINGVHGAERQGNSGGPVLTFIDGKPKIVGIVTGSKLDRDGNDIFQVYTPLSNIPSIQ